ncbi:phospholipase [Alcanivorax sp. N3-2A]|nr:phospholipase [Alcanivorax sp. N3-2A]|tara:strand:+ start:2477 stop:3478 length:1002 start_codon:yes stop_codon:yes gene_type:complete
MKRLLIALLMIASTPLFADDAAPDVDQQNDNCLLRAARNADQNVTLGELRQWCQKSQQSAPERSPHEDALRARLALENSSKGNPFVITPHNRNYVMPFSYHSNPQLNDPDRADRHTQSNELKFQLSLKAPLYDNFWGGSTLYAAFTGVFFWQAYNEDESRPFREINFTPELFVAKPVDWQLGPVDSELIAFGIRHDSNGRGVPASRSWNRLFVRHVSRIGPYYVSLMPWYRIPEQDKDDPMDARGDDNPDIEKYMGHFELELARAFGNHVVELKVRNNLRSENKGAGEVNYSFPLNKRFKGLVQVFTGYGDSLINYDDYETRFSVGILLTDTL